MVASLAMAAGAAVIAFLAQKGQDSGFEVSECRMTSIVGDMLVHQPP
jgi:hypothetical protein